MIEVLISAVLLGLVGTAMLTTLSVTINASAIERDHANAHAWLQIASDVLYGEELIPCDLGQTAVYNGYNGIVKGTDDPENWGSSNIEVVAPVLFWDGDVYQSNCYSAENINLQLITIQVKNPDGEIVESVQVVKG